MTTAKKTADTPKAEATDPATIAAMVARIEKLEGENKALRDLAPVPAPQAMDTVRKNPTENLVQITRSGNVRTTRDPSLEFVAEVAANTPAEKEVS